MQNFLISTLLFLSLEVLAETPKEFMYRYLEVWNQEDVEKYEATFAIPHTRDYDGVLTIVDEPNISLVNFDEIKQTGWVRSRIDSLETVMESENAAMMKFSFSRINSDGESYLAATGLYGLARITGSWQIQSIWFPSKITVGIEAD